MLAIDHPRMQHRAPALPGGFTSAVLAAIGEAVSHGKIEQDCFFFSSPVQQTVKARDRTTVQSSGLRRPEMLPPAEIRGALTTVVATHLGATSEEVIVESARLFGFKATSAQLREIMAGELDRLLREGEVEERNDRLYIRSC